MIYPWERLRERKAQQQSPFHMFFKRLTKCPNCGKRSWMKKQK